MIRRFRYLLLPASLALAAGPGMAADAGVLDCDSPGSWAERTVCRTARLRELDAQLQTLRRDLLLRSDDADALADDQRIWAGKRDACTTERCLDVTYRTRMDEFRQRIADAPPPLLLPGDYRRHAVGAAADDAPVLSVEQLDRHRYRLRALATAEAEAPLAEGEFEAQVGAARFEADGCTLRMSFAPDLISVSDAATACGIDLDGNYLRLASDP